MTVSRSTSEGKIIATLKSYPVLFLSLLSIVGLSLALPNFASAGNVNAILFEMSLGFLAAIGFTYLLVMGEIDLSIGATYGLCGTLCGSLLLAGFSLPVCIGAAILTSLAAGALNGWMVVQFGLNSLIVTIGSLTLMQGVTGVLTNEMGGAIYPAEFRSLAHLKILGWPWLIWLMVTVLLVLTWSESRLGLFRKIYYVGENRRSAVIYGMRERSLRILGFLASSFFAGSTGIIASARGARGDITLGVGLEFSLLVAAVVGGVSLFGGRGRMLNTFSGILFVTVLLTCLVMFNIEPLFQQCVVGTLLLAAVSVDRLLNTGSGKN